MRPNPYPWLPEWYWQAYASTIDEMQAWIVNIQAYARSVGFEISVIEQTPPQIGSAGTVTFRITCSTLGLDSTRLVDDRVALSFGGDLKRFLYWFVGAAACARYDSRLGPAYNSVLKEDRTGKAGRFTDRLKAGVVKDSVRNLFS